MDNSLYALPLEVLGTIISFCDTYPSLAKLARVSKHFQHLTLPHLYAHLSFGHERECNQNIKHLRPLTFLMLRNPQIAALVRRITLPSHYTTEHQEPPWKEWPRHSELDTVLEHAIRGQSGTSTDMKVITPVANDAQMDDQANPSVDHRVHQWLNIVRAGFNEAAILALLLPTLVNLQKLDGAFRPEAHGLGPDSQSGPFSFFICDMLKRAATRNIVVEDRPIFSNLTDVIINYPTYWRDVTTNSRATGFLALCVDLPALRRLMVRNQRDRPNSVFERPKPASASIDHIHLRHCRLAKLNLSNLLQAPKSLRTFVYHIDRKWPLTRAAISQIKLSLDFQRQSLERLSLAYDGILSDSLGTPDDPIPVTFNQYDSLKHLRVPPIFLYVAERFDSEFVSTTQDVEGIRRVLVEALPSSLETLELVRCDDHWMLLDYLVWSLDELLEHKKDQFSDLREISVDINREIVSDEVLEKLTALPWEANNVQLLVRDGNSSDPAEWGSGWIEDVEWSRDFAPRNFNPFPKGYACMRPF